jgi:Cysteine-rich CWC
MTKCPICNEENNCVMSKGEDPEYCWCMKVIISPQLLEETSSKRDCCICKKCIEEYHLKMKKG